MHWLDQKIKRLPNLAYDVTDRRNNAAHRMLKTILGPKPDISFYGQGWVEVIHHYCGQWHLIMGRQGSDVPGLKPKPVDTYRKIFKYLEANKAVIKSWIAQTVAEDVAYRARLEHQRAVSAARRQRERAAQIEKAAPRALKTLNDLTPKFAEVCVKFYRGGEPFHSQKGRNLVVEVLDALKNCLAPYHNAVRWYRQPNSYPYTYLKIGKWEYEKNNPIFELTLERGGMIFWCSKGGVLQQWAYSKDLDLMKVFEDIKPLLILGAIGA